MENFLCTLITLFPSLGNVLEPEDCPEETGQSAFITFIITVIAGIGLFFR